VPALLGATEGSPPIFWPCARLADFRIDFAGPAVGHYIA
jgi:hypothetical protein